MYQWPSATLYQHSMSPAKPGTKLSYDVNQISMFCPNVPFTGLHLQNCSMRLTAFERDSLKQAARVHFGEDAKVRLFGSRTNDMARGGDIDLLVESNWTDPAKLAQAHTQFLATAYTLLGEQKLDVLLDYPGRSTHPPIFELAREQGVLL